MKQFILIAILLIANVLRAEIHATIPENSKQREVVVELEPAKPADPKWDPKDGTFDPKKQDYAPAGQWFGGLYRYPDNDGKWHFAKKVELAKADGFNYDNLKDKNIFRVKAGDIVFQAENGNWYKADPEKAKRVDEIDLVPVAKDKDGKYVEMTDEERMVVYLTNRQRRAHGLPPLRVVPGLMDTARKQTQWMATGGGLNHTSLPVGENIAMGQDSPYSVVNSWMNSAGHRANILNGGYTSIGVGKVGEGYPFWTQQFTR